jgi:hypothetical protein
MNKVVIDLLSSSEDEDASSSTVKQSQNLHSDRKILQAVFAGMPMPLENLKEIKVEKQTAKVKQHATKSGPKIFKKSCKSRPQYDAKVCIYLLFICHLL